MANSRQYCARRIEGTVTTQADQAPTAVEPRVHLSEVDFYGVSHPGRVPRRNADRFLVASYHRALQVHGSNAMSSLLPFSSDSRGVILMVADGVGQAPLRGEVGDRAMFSLAQSLLEMREVSMQFQPEREHELVNRLREAFGQVMESLRADVGDAPTLSLFLALWPKVFVLHTGGARYDPLPAGAVTLLTAP